MVTEKQPSGRSRKWQDLVQYLVLIGIIIVANILAQRFFFRLDLTEDNRYSIAPATKEILENLDDVVYVEVYLEGEFPAGFKRLQQAIEETLEEFRIYGGDNIQYQFVDPSANPDIKARNEYYQQLAKKGIQPTNLFAIEGDKRVEKVIFPGAIVSYRDKEIPLLLLKGNQALSPDQQLNQSVEGVEYELASAIRKLTVVKKRKIGFVEGHGELPVIEMADFVATLQQYHDVSRIDLPNKISLKEYDAIVIARPTEKFSEPDKFKIDQFIMGGGKVMFCIDPMNINLDSIGEEGTFSFPYQLNLDDLFFKYGVRLNADLIQDINSGYIPMVVGITGNQPQTQMMNWRFYPLVNNFSNHPITRNLDAVYSKFIGTIDTVKATGITKTPLILTSPYSRIMQAPVPLTLEEARMEVRPEQYQAGPLPVGYLLEGTFTSLFRNRRAPEGVDAKTVKEKGKYTRIAVFSDGDLIRNDVNARTGQAYELGFDRYNNVTFANKELAINTVHYLLDGEGLINVRSKEIKLRPLDRVRVKEEKTFWQLLNLGAPIVMLAVFGLYRYYMRRRKYEKF